MQVRIEIIANKACLEEKNVCFAGKEN